MNFSVLMPVYIKENPAFFISALNSMLNQTLPPEEILIVADGPLSSQLNEVLDDYQSRYPRLFTILRLEENKGMGFAMDTGVRACRNEWVARMDSDDIAVPERFEKQVAYLTRFPEVDIIGASIEEFNNAPGDLNRKRVPPETHERLRQFMKFRCPMNHMTVFFRKKSVLAAGSYWHKRAFEDYHLWYQMMAGNAVFHNLPDVLVHARVGNNMLERRRGLSYIKNELNLFRIMRNDGFISGWEYYKYSTSRALSRLMPKQFLSLAYKYILRK